MKPIAYLASDLPTPAFDLEQANTERATQTASARLDPGSPQKETLRHILLGSPGAVRQTIYLLHSLHYAEPVLWSPIMSVGEEMIITPAQGEAMSLLRRSL
ncbi:MAG: hypothetical protein WBC73_08180 [Phormidesmis sp.]